MMRRTTRWRGPSRRVHWVRDGRGQVSDDYLDAETRRRFALQEPLSAAANTIYDAADEGEAQGYTGIVLDVEGGQVHVYWYGTAPAAVISAITATRGTSV